MVSRGLTHKDLILQMCGLSGEYPVRNVSNLVLSGRAKDVVLELQNKGLIKKVKLKDGTKVFRLDKKGKQLLIEKDNGRFANYLYGNVNTNRIPTDMTAKKRLMSYAEVYTIMYHAGVLLFDTEKLDIFPETSPPGALAPAPLDENKDNLVEQRLGSGILSSQPSEPSRPRIVHPSFYTTRVSQLRKSKRQGVLNGRFNDSPILMVDRGIIQSPSKMFTH